MKSATAERVKAERVKAERVKAGHCTRVKAEREGRA
jgi:hypothetical protein